MRGAALYRGHRMVDTNAETYCAALDLTVVGSANSGGNKQITEQMMRFHVENTACSIEAGPLARKVTVRFGKAGADFLSALQHGATGDDPVIESVMAVNEGMRRDMAIVLACDADAEFVSGMVPRHQGVIDMARVFVLHGSDTEFRALAVEVTAAQEGEIAPVGTRHVALADANRPTSRNGERR